MLNIKMSLFISTYIYTHIKSNCNLLIKIDFLVFNEQPDIKGPLSRLAYPVDQIDKIGLFSLITLKVFSSCHHLIA